MTSCRVAGATTGYEEGEGRTDSNRVLGTTFSWEGETKIPSTSSSVAPAVS